MPGSSDSLAPRVVAHNQLVDNRGLYCTVAWLAPRGLLGLWELGQEPGEFALVPLELDQEPLELDWELLELDRELLELDREA